MFKKTKAVLLLTIFTLSFSINVSASQELSNQSALIILPNNTDIPFEW